MLEAHHSIKFVARRTGLTPHVIRVWERRYGAVKPNRTETNRRLYSNEDIERLSLLRQAIQAGHSIGNIAALPEETLHRLAAQHGPPAEDAETVSGPKEFIREALKAVQAMEQARLDEILGRGIVSFGQHGLLEKLIGPLAHRVGELWREGELSAAHEHFASAAIRSFLGKNSHPFSASLNAPVLVVGTPSGQLHELGAVMVASAAIDVGWRAVYLGPSLPAGEIAGAVAKNNARALALSIVYPEDDPDLPKELENLRKYLTNQVPILAGGRAAESYASVLNAIGAVRLNGFKELYAKLDEWRKPLPPDNASH